MYYKYLSVCILLFAGMAKGQYFNYPGAELTLGAGLGSNQQNYTRKAAPGLQLQGALQVPVIFDHLYLLPGVALEWNMRNPKMPLESATLGFSQASYITPGIRAEFMFSGANKLQRFSVGAGYAARFKMVESNFWDERPTSGFPQIWADQSNLFPVFFRAYRKNKKVDLIFESQLFAENHRVRPNVNQWSFNTFQCNFGIVYRPPKKIKPENYRPACRTMMAPPE